MQALFNETLPHLRFVNLINLPSEVFLISSQNLPVWV